MSDSSHSTSSTSSSNPSSTVQTTTPITTTNSSTSPTDSITSTTTGNAQSSQTSAPTGLGPPSSSLYLFTFLATLFLLLAISSAIIMRGIFLRRRFRRRLEEAIAAGVLYSPSDDGTGGFGSGRSPRRKLQRPTLYDVSVLPPYFATSTTQDGTWEKLMPFSGNIAAEKPGQDPQQELDAAAQGGAGPRRGPRLTGRALLERAGYLIPRSRLRRSRAPTPAPNAQPAFPASASGDTITSSASASEGIPLAPRPQDPVQRAAAVRVAVVIAMPDPHRASYVPPAADAEMHAAAAGRKGKARGGADGWGEAGDVEAGVPDVVFGTARLAVAEAADGEGGAEGDAGALRA